jgi:predicted enzyme related to lactoylglutathione lyase
MEDYRNKRRSVEEREMTSTIAVLAIDAMEPRRVADFWAAALGWQIIDEDDDGVSIAPSTGAWPTIDVFRVPESKSVKNRLHLDLRANGTSTDDEVNRLLQLGARMADVGQSPDSTWTVLADPEGNEFCVLSRTVQDTKLDN